MKLKFVPESIIKAVSQYHRNRAAATEKKPWDKAGDMAFFEETAAKIKEINYWQASVGSFWITWKHGEQTVHNEKNLGGIVVAVRGEDGEWHEKNGVDFFTGEAND